MCQHTRKHGSKFALLLRTTIKSEVKILALGCGGKRVLVTSGGVVQKCNQYKVRV